MERIEMSSYLDRLPRELLIKIIQEGNMWKFKFADGLLTVFNGRVSRSVWIEDSVEQLIDCIGKDTSKDWISSARVFNMEVYDLYISIICYQGEKYFSLNDRLMQNEISISGKGYFDFFIIPFSDCDLPSLEEALRITKKI